MNVQKSQANNNSKSTLLDYSKNNSNTFCGKKSLIGPANKTGNTLYTRIFCNRYGCEICGERKRWLVAKVLERIIVEKKMQSMATLTIDPKSCKPEESGDYIKKLWNKHRTYQRRRFGKENLPSYVYVVEFQKKTKNAHLHVLFSDFVPWSWLSNTWQAVGGGFCHITKVDEKGAWYLAKYLNKEFEIQSKKRMRRLCCSRDIKLKIKNPNSNFEFRNIDYDDLKSLLGDNISEIRTWGKNLETGFESPNRQTFI